MRKREADPIWRGILGSSVLSSLAPHLTQRPRRRWSAEAKTRLVEESLKPGSNVLAIARQVGLASSQLFAGGARRSRAVRSGRSGIGLGSALPKSCRQHLRWWNWVGWRGYSRGCRYQPGASDADHPSDSQSMIPAGVKVLLPARILSTARLCLPRGGQDQDCLVGWEWSVSLCQAAGQRDVLLAADGPPLAFVGERRLVRSEKSCRPCSETHAARGQIRLSDHPCAWNARQTRAIVSTDIPTPSARYDKLMVANQSIRGSKLDADSPAYGLNIVHRFTAGLGSSHRTR